MKSAGLPSIAVIVPNRNDSRYLPVCLRSILSQEVKPDELIVVDDQSTDDSVQIVRSLLSAAPFARLVENPVNLGTYGALHEGLKHSRSDYVLFLSSNDFVLPGIFARAKRALSSSPGAALWSAMVWIVDEAGTIVRLHNSPVVSLADAYLSPERCRRLACRLGGWFGSTTLTYHRRVLDEVGRFDPAYGGLADLLCALSMAARQGAVYSPEPLAAIRKHAGGYLSRTLSDPPNLERVLARIGEKGPKVAPGLFTPEFIERTHLRFRFAAARASGAESFLRLAESTPRWQGGALRAVARAIPARLRGLRVALCFLILRPFDLLPALWYRVLGGLLVRLRVQFSGRPANQPGA